MRGEETVYKAVKSASRVSKRNGKWANLPEIKKKAPEFNQAFSPVLSYLVRHEKIEKKSGMALWRPRGLAGGGIGKSGSKGERGGRTTGGGRRPDERKGERRGNTGDITRVAAGATAAAASRNVSSSITRMLF